MTIKAIAGALLLTFVQAANAAAPELFVFDNGVGRGKWTPEEQAATLKELGYDGISYNYTTPKDLAAWQKAFKEKGLKIYGLYVGTYLDRTNHFDPAFKDAVKLLRGTDTVIWMTVMKPEKKGDHDVEAAKVVQEMADLAAENGVRVALYGHFGLYVETSVDSARIVKLANRPNVGATINLCHEFLSGRGGHLDETIRAVAPIALRASVNGVNGAGTNFSDIVRLDQGDFDVALYLKKLLVAGYRGPIGLQCYNVPGDTKENLKADMAAWKKIREILEQNTLTPKEAAAGWRLLFDGCTTAGWRGYQNPAFPDHGWGVEDGCLKSLGQNGGDIVTTTIFTNFELCWEWRIAPRANSGLKYFVDENRQAAKGDPTNPDPCVAHEYQMIDDDHYPEALAEIQKTASWYAVMAPKHAAPNPVGEFNQSRLVVRGRNVEHWLNGKRVLVYRTDSAESVAGVAASKFKTVPDYGDKIPTPILLQDHGGIAWVRNIKIRELP